MLRSAWPLSGLPGILLQINEGNQIKPADIRNEGLLLQQP